MTIVELPPTDILVIRPQCQKIILIKEFNSIVTILDLFSSFFFLLVFRYCN